MSSSLCNCKPQKVDNLVNYPLGQIIEQLKPVFVPIQTEDALGGGGGILDNLHEVVPCVVRWKFDQKKLMCINALQSFFPGKQ